STYTLQVIPRIELSVALRLSRRKANDALFVDLSTFLLLSLVKGILKEFVEFGENLVSLFTCKLALTQKLCDIKVAHVRVSIDLFVHPRLSKRRLIALV